MTRQQAIDQGRLLVFTKEEAVSELLCWFTPRQISMNVDWLRLNLEFHLRNNVEIKG